MRIIDIITDGIRRILGIKKKVLVGKIMKGDEIDQLSKDLEYERGYKEGQIGALEEEKKDLQMSLGKVTADKDIDIAKYLQKQQKSMYYNQFNNSLSMKKMFAGISYLKKPIKVTSYNSKKLFGELDDILIRPDGRFAVVSKNGKGKEPIMVGPTVRELFRNYEGLSNNVALGFLQLNLDENKKFVRNEEDADVPEVVIDGTGKINISRINKEKYLKQIIDKESQINELYGIVGMYEEELQKLTSNKHLLKLISKHNESRASIAETELVNSIKSINEVHASYSELTKELAQKGNQEYLNERKINQMDNIHDKIISKMDEVLGKAETEVAREQYIKIANDIIDLTQGTKINIQTQPQKQQPEADSGRLTAKFQKA